MILYIIMNMDGKKKQNLFQVIVLVSCFSLLAGACENNDRIEVEAQDKNVPLNFDAAIMNTTVTETRRFDKIPGFIGGTHHFGMSITKGNETKSEVFEGSANLKVTMADDNAGGWNWSFTRKPGDVGVTPMAPEGKSLKIVAYYPYIEGEDILSNGIPFDFTAVNNPVQNELLYNANTQYTIIPGTQNPTIPLKFQRAYTWITIKVTKYVDKGTFELTDLNINNRSGEWIKNSGRINPETGYPMDGATVGPIGEAISPTALHTLTPIEFNFLVPSFMDPSVKSDDIAITMTINERQEVFFIKREHLNNDGDAYGFQQGYHNTYKLVFNNSSLQLFLVDWTPTQLSGDFGGDVTVPTNYVTLNMRMNSGSVGYTWASYIEGGKTVYYPQKFELLGAGNHDFESYITTVSYGGNGKYVTASPILQPSHPDAQLVSDDLNVATMEKVYPLIDMTTENISIEPVPWQDENGDLVAKELCRKYRGGGHTNWRLPRASELRGVFALMIFNSGTDTPLNKLNLKGNALNTLYWTGTEESDKKAWSMYYYEGSKIKERGPMISPLNKRSTAHVRCIREAYSK